jgi:hypothetical protein
VKRNIDIAFVADQLRNEIVALRGQIDLLTFERDEARRMWCEAEAVGNCLSVDDMKRRARAEAKRREWDCYKEDGK